MKFELFNSDLVALESIFNGKPGVLKRIAKVHSVIVNPDIESLIDQHDWWRERNEENGQCYFRTHGPINGVQRPLLHRLIAGISDPKVRVDFENGCCFDLRRANLKITR